MAQVANLTDTILNVRKKLKALVLPAPDRYGQRQDPKESLLPSTNHDLCAFLEGGLKFGQISEWGVPRGFHGREVILTFLASYCFYLWIYPKGDLIAYPPAWAARGINLDNIRFVKSSNILDALKPVFLEPTFKVIVIDSVPSLNEGDLAFLARRIKLQNQALIILQDCFLTLRRGNVWAKLRLNCSWNEKKGGFCLNVIKGLSPRQLLLKNV